MFTRLLLLSAAWMTPSLMTAAEPFELKTGDRVVLLGDTFIEREQYHGWIELALTARFPDRDITFRNLGWSADTPAGDSRYGLSLLQAGLEPSDEGWKQLQEQLRQARPTVVILGYGMASSFDGERGLPRFQADMIRLMDTIRGMNRDVRFVLLGPVPHQGRSDLSIAHNRQLKRYTQTLQELASRRQSLFISLADLAGPRISDNGIHLTSTGYQAAARRIEEGLGWPPGNWHDRPEAERLRQAILKKNELFFHRSRPANMAYIFGFRKREQGKNAVEIPQFDALIEAEEKKIALLRRLEPVELPAGPPPRTKAAAARFTPQPRPAFEAAPGLEVSLWAENPLLHKPIQMNFDPQGRLWIASSEVYPQIEPGQTAADKIIILQDADGDGKAERSTVFADGLLIPTGLAPGDGGVYVAQSTELLHLRDADGDGKADQRRIVLSGFGTEDTHHNLHTLGWGPDGRLYMQQSIYTRTDTETPHGVLRLKSGGGLRLDARSQRLDVVFRGLWNSWGRSFDAHGQVFLTDGAGSSGINYSFPGATFVAYARARRILDGASPGSYPKFCGLEIVRSRHFPDDWQGDLITCDFRANRVVRFRLMDDGAGFAAQEIGDVLRSPEVSFRPIDVKMGPDGAMYIADWSNPIINHGEVDFRDPRRDREHGRIWRVTVKGRPANPVANLMAKSNPELLDLLESPNGYDREQARRVLAERGSPMAIRDREQRAAVLADLDAWQARQTEEADLLEALWLRQALAADDPRLLGRLLEAQDYRVRAAAVRVLADRGAALAPLQALIADAHPRVRLEAVRALGRNPSAEAADAALSVLARPMDRFLEHALWLTMIELAEPWLAALVAGKSPIEGRDKALAFGLGAVPPEKATEALGKLLEKRPLTRDGGGPWIELIGQAGGPGELKLLVDRVTQEGFDNPAAVRALGALAEAARLRRVRPAGDLDSVVRLLESDTPAIQAGAARVAGRWKMEKATPRLAALAGDAKASLPVRLAACEALRECGGPAAVAGLRAAAGNAAEPVSLRRQAGLALAAIDPEGALPLVRELLAAADGPDAGEFWRSLLGHAGMSKRLAGYLEKESIPAAAAAAGLRVARENDESNRALVKVLASLAGVTEPRVYAARELKQLTRQVWLTGDAARGEMVYRKAELRCLVCHAIGGAGGKVGPDLSSLGAGAPVDYLIESVLLPNRKIKENYHAQVVLTADGRVLTGIPVRETPQELILRDAEDREIAIPRRQIEERAGADSLMPAGLVDGLSDQERVDLFRFLAELGRPGPFDVSKSKSPRVWRVMDAARAGAGAVRGDKALADWTAIPTTVGGGLPRQDVLAAFGGKPPERILAATRFEAPMGGTATVEVQGGTVRRAWLDGRELKGAGSLALEFSAGGHSLVVELEPARLSDLLLVRAERIVFTAQPR